MELESHVWLNIKLELKKIKYFFWMFQVQMYSLQMLHQHIQFSALGFVTVDYSLLYSVSLIIFLTDLGKNKTFFYRLLGLLQLT